MIYHITDVIKYMYHKHTKSLTKQQQEISLVFQTFQIQSAHSCTGYIHFIRSVIVHLFQLITEPFKCTVRILNM